MAAENSGLGPVPVCLGVRAFVKTAALPGWALRPDGFCRPVACGEHVTRLDG